MLIFLIFCYILIQFNILSQINDNFSSSILESEDSDLLDIVDYENLFLIVSRSSVLIKSLPIIVSYKLIFWFKLTGMLYKLNILLNKLFIILLLIL